MVHLLHKQYQNYIFPLLKVSKSVGHGEIAYSFISLVLWLCFWRRSRWWQNRSPLSRYIKGTMLNFWVCALIPITNIEEGNQISLILKPIESYYMFLYRVFFCTTITKVRHNLKWTDETEKNFLKLVDFGLSDYYLPDKEGNENVGSLYYRAP